jgi:hypothetical protein
MKPFFKIVFCSILLSLVIGCEKDEDSPANLTLSNINFIETSRNEVLDLPNGTYVPDNPDFDINNSKTWTGNIAKYVNHNYIYSVSYNIKNIGSTVAYDTEIDLHYIYDNDDEKVETIYIGNIKPNESISSSSSAGCTNKQLIKCNAEVFWSD